MTTFVSDNFDSISDQFEDSLEFADMNLLEQHYNYDQDIENNFVSSGSNHNLPTIVSKFVPLKDHTYNDDSENYMDENINTTNNCTEFKLPPRLAARLYKKTSQNKPPKVLQNLENIRTVENLPLIRRETIVVRPKKNKPNPNQNSTIVHEKNNVNNQTVLIDNETEDLRYVNWINSVIATSFNIENVNVDLSRIINDCILSDSSQFKNKNSNNASKPCNQMPLKDGISSMAYKEIKMMDILRVKATQLYQSNQLKLVKEVLLEDLKLERFYIRKDKSIHADVGAKKHILEIFLNYNPLWLKIALETIFSQRIEKNNRNEVHTLIHFLTQRLLSFKEIALKRNCKNVTTFFMNDRNVKQAKQHILYNFLLIINFLDIAKRNRLIDHDPCLFRTDAICKSSRDIVVAFSREYITGVGDIFKCLRSVGIHLEHVQNPIEEFNFTVTKLSQDLRCGVRLARLAEILLLRNDILPKLYFPPNSITRKIHNMELVFKMLGPIINDLPKTLVPRDICNGYRQKTIIFLDKLINIYNIRLRDIELQQSIESIIKIQRCFRRFLECRSQRKYYLQLKATAIIVQKLFRFHRETKRIRNEYLSYREAIIFVQRKYRANKLCKIERARYNLLHSSTLIIQKFYRSYQKGKEERNYYLNLKQYTVFIQKCFRLKKLGKIQREQFLLKRNAILTIQQFYRSYLERKRFIQLKQSVLFIQRCFRNQQLAKQTRERFLKQKQSAITIQRFWRLWYRKKELNRVAILVQRRFRANLMRNQCQNEYLKIRKNIILIQRFYRAHLQTIRDRNHFKQVKSSSVMIQKVWKGYHQRKEYLQLRQSAIILQRAFRAKNLMNVDRNLYLNLKHSTIFVQRRFRQNLQFKKDHQNYLLMKKSAIIIQRFYKTRLQRKFFLQICRATLCLQIRFKANILARAERQNYLQKRKSAILIQKQWRSYLKKKEMNKAALTIQYRYRAWKLMKQEKTRYLRIKNATLIVQRRYRALVIGRAQREHFQKLRSTTIWVQRFYRERKRSNLFKSVVDQYVAKVNQAAITIQQIWRGYSVRKNVYETYPTLIYIRERLEYVNQNATEDKILVNVIYRILERVCRVSSINQLHYDIEKLELGTNLSTRICEIIIENDWIIKTLLISFNCLNRSEPHKKIILNILGIFLNIIEKTQSKVLYSNEEMLEVIFKILRNFPKSNNILSRTLRLLIYLLQNNRTLKIYKEDKHFVSTLDTFIHKQLPANFFVKSVETPRKISRQNSCVGLSSLKKSSSSSSLLSQATTSKVDPNSISSLCIKIYKLLRH